MINHSHTCPRCFRHIISSVSPVLPPHLGPFACFPMFQILSALVPLCPVCSPSQLTQEFHWESCRYHLDQISFFYYIFPLSCLKTFLKCLIEYLCIDYYEFPYFTVSSMKPEETCLFSLPSFKHSEQDVKYL